MDYNGWMSLMQQRFPMQTARYQSRFPGMDQASVSAMLQSRFPNQFARFQGMAPPMMPVSPMPMGPAMPSPFMGGRAFPGMGGGVPWMQNQVQPMPMVQPPTQAPPAGTAAPTHQQTGDTGIAPSSGGAPALPPMPPTPAPGAPPPAAAPPPIDATALWNQAAAQYPQLAARAAGYGITDPASLASYGQQYFPNQYAQWQPQIQAALPQIQNSLGPPPPQPLAPPPSLPHPAQGAYSAMGGQATMPKDLLPR